MTKTGRNALCPCGSGKKYKHCCLVTRSVLQEQRDAKIRAVDWLTDTYGDAVRHAVMNQFFQSEEDDAPERINGLAEHMQGAENLPAETC